MFFFQKHGDISLFSHKLFLEDLCGPEKDLKIVYSNGLKKDQLEDWQVFYGNCCLTSAFCRGGGGWVGGY